jgi:hypothetical protein
VSLDVVGLLLRRKVEFLQFVLGGYLFVDGFFGEMGYFGLISWRLEEFQFGPGSLNVFEDLVHEVLVPEEILPN